MEISLVILAAGIGSRYGGVKQLEPVGPGGELIIDYSIHDAVKAGFNKVVFIIRRDIFKDFYEVIGERMEKRFKELGIAWEYAYQALEGAPEGRTKPWGTGQALMSCKGLLNGPFAVINADDYYGRDAYVKAYEFITQMKDEREYGMMGYVLKNTLSDNGGVTRGVCLQNENGELCGIDETKNIVKTADGKAKAGEREIPLESLVSMNFWMLPLKYIDLLEEGFPAFKENMRDPLKDEYLLPTIVDRLIKEKRCSVKVVPTSDSWFGVTYKEDKPAVTEEFKKLYDRNAYALELYSDIVK